MTNKSNLQMNHIAATKKKGLAGEGGGAVGGNGDKSSVLTLYKAKDKKNWTCVCTHRHTHKRQKVVRSWRAL